MLANLLSKLPNAAMAYIAMPPFWIYSIKPGGIIDQAWEMRAERISRKS